MYHPKIIITMTTKTHFLCLLLFAAANATAQITNSLGIDPTSISNYDGSYDHFGQGHLYYPNAGEVRLTNEERSDALDYVKFYTMYTEPKIYLQNNNNLSTVFTKNDLAASALSLQDSLQRIDIEWARSNGGALLARADTQNFGKLNYFNEWFGTTGRTNVAGGAAIACQSIYNNIDLVYTSNNAGIVMYFIVYPGGDYNDIFLHFNGSNSSSIVGNKLVAQGSWADLTLQQPQMYQYTIIGGVVTPLTVCPANWVNTGPDTYQINTSTPYNTALPLIIQIKQNDAVNANTPGLCWSTYFGGSQFEFMTKSRTDASDNYYIAGSSNGGANNFPQGPGVAVISTQAVDGAIVKFNPAGQIQWSTFIGGSSNENIRDFAFYGNSIYCVGRTASDNNVTTPFPTQAKAGAFNDATWGGGTAPWDGFIYEFEFDVQLNQFQTNWSTLFGGNGWDDLYGCEIDASGNLYIVGASSSSDMSIQAISGGYLQNFNTAQLSLSTPESTDGIIGKFNAAGAQVWFTFFGTDALGTNAYTHAADYFYGLKVAGNNVYACGKSGGTNLPGAVNSKLAPGQFDGILANFTPNGALTASKFTDGNIANYAVNEIWGEVYTVGEANSAMHLVNSGLWYHNSTSSGNTDACFSVHPSNLATTTHNSFLGGNDEDVAYDVRFSTNNLLLIAGGTRSSNFPVTSLGAMYNVSFAGGFSDNFIAAFQKGDPNMTWSSCLGSNLSEAQQMPPFINSMFDIANATIAVDSQNRLRLLGSTTSFNTFPLDNGNNVPYFKANSGGMGNDATITCFDMADLSAVVGLKDFENTQFVFGLYPNPASKHLSVTNTSAFANEDLRYAIYEVSGKKLQTGSLKASEKKEIDVSALQQGIYIINVSDGIKTVSNKFIKAEN
jgi:hypothetical protein